MKPHSTALWQVVRMNSRIAGESGILYFSSSHGGQSTSKPNKSNKTCLDDNSSSIVYNNLNYCCLEIYDTSWKPESALVAKVCCGYLAVDNITGAWLALSILPRRRDGDVEGDEWRRSSAQAPCCHLRIECSRNLLLRHTRD
jgi:hypothetical protein